MLQKAFSAGSIKPEEYSAKYARFIYSDVLGLKDKERVLFSRQESLVEETTDLPLKLTCKNVPFDGKAFDRLPITRTEECAKICRAVQNSDMRSDSAYRPLCLVGDSEYILRLNAEAIGEGFSSAHVEHIHVEHINVAELRDYDVEPTCNNVFVGRCDEDKQNVYVLYFIGEIGINVMNAATNFLKTDNRSRFRLVRPSVEINLSAIIPVCVCDKANLRMLEKYCDVVSVAPLGTEEKRKVLAHIINTKAERYTIDSVKVAPSAEKFLTECSIDRAETLIDKAVRFHRGEETLTITAAVLKEISDSEASAVRRYGFGGVDNENQ